MYKRLLFVAGLMLALTVVSADWYAGSVTAKQVGETYGRVQPPREPAPGKNWEQLAPYVWYYHNTIDETAYTDKWYVMGRDGLQWALDNYWGPLLKEAKVRQAIDPSNADNVSSVEYYESNYGRIVGRLDSAEPYISGSEDQFIQNIATACNYASTYANISPSQIRVGGEACANSSTPYTYVDYNVKRGGQWETNSTTGGAGQLYMLRVLTFLIRSVGHPLPQTLIGTMAFLSGGGTHSIPMKMPTTAIADKISAYYLQCRRG